MNLAINNNLVDSRRSVPLRDLFDSLDLDISYSVKQIGITGLANDSRKVRPGDLFFAVPGFVTDGAKYISEATSLGAKVIVTQSPDIKVDYLPVIQCRDIRKIISSVAARFYQHPSTDVEVVGITGTNGKTTVSYLLSHMLGGSARSWGRIGTVEYFTGKNTIRALNTTPDSIDLQKCLAEMRDFGMAGCAMEVSSHGLDLHRCDDIEFEAAVFTNLTQDHLDYHKDMESYFAAKSILFSKLLRADGLAVLNADDAYFEKLKELCPTKTIAYSVSAAHGKRLGAHLMLEDAGATADGRKFKMTFDGRSHNGILPLLGRFNLANAAASAATAIGLGLEAEKVIESLKTAPQVPGRVERIDEGQPFQVIIDYAHTPDALKNLLEGVDSQREKILVFGCGGDRDKTKRPLMGGIAAGLADRMFVTSDNPRTEDPVKIINDILKGMPKSEKISVNEKRDEAIGRALALAKPGDLVIIAGKGHEDYQIVGNTRHYFSDPDVVRSHLKKLGYGSS